MLRIPLTLAAAWLGYWHAQAAAPLLASVPEVPTPIGTSNLPNEPEIRFRMAMMHSPVSSGYDADVGAYLSRYLTYGSIETEAILGRGMVYLPVIEHYLEKCGLPTQLKFLPIIESKLQPHAESTKGAAGLWQLVPETARSLGLVVDAHLDERKDMNRATEAATSYLKRLYKKYGTWELALLAYNCGPGRLDQAIKKAGCQEYAQVRQHLPAETQNYIAKYKAALYIGTFHLQHGLSPTLPDPLLLHAMAARVYRAISIKKIAEATGLSIGTIRFLNPSYREDNLPARKAGTFLTLPKTSWEAYMGAVQRAGIKA
ncbi:MAG: lytic transglycosylase domain-containing protein [Saprospiraceae bacterium]|nr:lytic transglycosylase domain-containing protein [Saprospiraceae bacterium]